MLLCNGCWSPTRFQQEVTQVKEILTKEEKAAQEKKELEAKLAELQRKSEQIKKEEEELKKKERVKPCSPDLFPFLFPLLHFPFSSPLPTIT